jgi:hypothetical protein
MLQAEVSVRNGIRILCRVPIVCPRAALREDGKTCFESHVEQIEQKQSCINNLVFKRQINT